MDQSISAPPPSTESQGSTNGVSRPKETLLTPLLNLIEPILIHVDFAVQAESPQEPIPVEHHNDSDLLCIASFEIQNLNDSYLREHRRIWNAAGVLLGSYGASGSPSTDTGGISSGGNGGTMNGGVVTGTNTVNGGCQANGQGSACFMGGGAAQAVKILQ